MKQIVKNFNNLIKKTIFKVQNKTNNNFNISSFNKYLIVCISSLFIYLFYLLIPLLYDKTWVQANIESKLFSEFKVNLSTSANITYRILPAPHYLIKDSKILVDNDEKQKSIAEIKNLKMFLSQKNLFNKKKMNIKKVVISDANFTLLLSDFKLLDKSKSKNFSNKKIIVNRSNIFFKDNIGDIISIIKITKGILFFDQKKLLNLFNIQGEIFNLPFNFDYQFQNDFIKDKKINLNFKTLKLNILNKSTKKDNLIMGENIILFLNSKINTKYNIKEKLIIFESDNSKVYKSKVDYGGSLSIKPFDLDFNIYLVNNEISRLFNINPILIEFIKSKLIFNENININTSIVVNSNFKNDIFHNAKINFQISDGKINLNNTKFFNNEIGSLELIDSNLFLRNDNLVFNGNILIEIKSSDQLFSFFNTNKSVRKSFKNVLINLEYDFLTNQFEFNSVKVDNSEVNSQLLRIIEGFNDNDHNNFNKSRRLINEIIKSYAG